MLLKDLEQVCKEGSTFENKTLSYISPLARFHGKDFLNLLKGFKLVAAGIKDSNCPDRFDKYSFGLLINARKSRHLNFYHPKIIDQYYFGELIYGHLHMLVIPIPDIYREAYDNFKKSKYSKMFDKPETVYKHNEVTIYRTIKAKCLDVCKRDPKLIKRLEEHLGAKVTGELDSRINKKREYFNYVE